MGFLESLGRFMSGLFPSQQNKWEENLTLEQIEDLERQGCDMTEYRQRFEEREAARKAHLAEIRQKSLDALDMERLTPYLNAVPRDLESEFVKDAVAFNHLPSKKIKRLADAPIVYASVVQAHYALYEPGAVDEQGYGVVFCFALDEKHKYDTVWLRELAGKISEMKESSSVPSDCAKFIKTLRDDQSIFCFKLGESLCGDADAWCATHPVYFPSRLPLGYLPATKILPMLLIEKPEVNQPIELRPIPFKYYTNLG